MVELSTRFVEKGLRPKRLKFKEDDVSDLNVIGEKIQLRGDEIYSIVSVEQEEAKSFARVRGRMGEKTLSFEKPTDNIELKDFEELLEADELFEESATITDFEVLIDYPADNDEKFQSEKISGKRRRYPGNELALIDIWETCFPFDYWQDRVNRLEEDAVGLDSFRTLCEMADLYTHLLVANLKYPYEPWHTLKEETYISDIKEFMEHITGEMNGDERISLTALIEKPGEYLDVNPNNLPGTMPVFDFFVKDILGCPGEIQPDGKVDFSDDYPAYIDACDNVLEFSHMFRGQCLVIDSPLPRQECNC